MDTPKTKVGSAALWFAMDGYSTAKGMNGRRVAGESFLKGYVRHTRAEEIAAYGSSSQSIKGFNDLAAGMGNKRPVVGGTFDQFELPGKRTNLYLPTPNITDEAWRRSRVKADSYSISGVTHTISTERVMRAFCELRVGPVMPWDAVICTSKAVYDSMIYQLDEYDDHLKFRFGSVPERFQMPIIPLGINTDDFTIQPGERETWRKKLSIGADDIAVVSIARLASFEKFDPLPMYKSLQAAAEKSGKKVHLIGLGQYSDNVAKKMFENGQDRYAPDVTFHHVDGSKQPENRRAMTAADVFALPVDNIQETFGLSPVEAMAAGLPVVVTDWNGFRDNVTTDCGFLLRTTGPTPGSLGREAERYGGKLDSYNQFIGLAAQMTVVDIQQMTDAFAALFSSPDLRQKMGAAGQKRARSVLDWKQIIPQYEDLWAELDTIRARAGGLPKIRRNSPEIPDPTHMFANYPTDIFDRSGTFQLSPLLKGQPEKVLLARIQEVILLRGLNVLKRKSASLAQYAGGIKHIAKAGQISFDDLVAAFGNLPEDRVERVVLWFLKYGLVERVTE